MAIAARSLTADLRRVLPPAQVMDTVEDRTLYAYDGTSIKALPDVITHVRSAAEVSVVLRFASDHAVPVVPRGAGTGLSGGSVPAQGGIALVLAGMRNIKELDATSMVAVVEPGVITGVFQKTVEDAGMFYPPDPASLNYCTLGGNIAENAGGPHGVKYGVTKDYVLGLEVVMPSGDVVRLGGKQIKNVTGYNLVQLFVGSEGTLGVITEATLRLLPKPPAKKTMLAIFDRLDDAATAVAGIMAGGVIPATLEIMDQKSINCVEDYLKLGLPRDAEAVLLIEVDGMPAAVEAEAEVIGRICREKGVRSFQAAKDKKEEESLWKARRSISPAISAARPSKIGEDISVPRSAIPAMVREIQRIAKEYDLPIVIFGHAGDGNLHPNILTDRRDHKEMERVEQAIEAIFEASVKLGGTLSGEHGIGLSKRPYMDLAVSQETLKLMVDIKRAVDPKNILNPGEDLEGVMEFRELAALFKCNKCGSCTSVCPLYQNTVYEGMAARGKLALLEAVADGRLKAGETVRAKLEDCLLCGACSQNCPSFVPTTDLFLEARAGLAKDLGLPVPIRMLLAALQSPVLMSLGTPPLALLQRAGIPRIMLAQLGGLLPEVARAGLRSLPPAPLQSFRARAKRLPTNGDGRRGTVGYFAGCFMNWGYADAAMATRTMLTRGGFRVEVPAVVCCGVPHRAYGDIDAARDLARKNIAALEKYEHVVTDCASCGAALKEYRHLLKDDPEYCARAENLSGRATDISEFLVKQEFPKPQGHVPLRVTYHDPCHLVRGQGIKSQPREILKAIPGVEYVEMKGADVCCGAAGSFCVTHPALSEGVGNNKADSIVETEADVVVSGCPSCLTQLKAMLVSKGSKVKVMHPMELLAESYKKNDP